MRTRPYLVLASAGADRVAWLEARRRHLTATDVSKWLGTSPWGDRDSVIESKLNDVPFRNRYAEYGSFFEDTNRRFFSRIVGKRSRATHAMIVSTICPSISCTLDGVMGAVYKDPEYDLTTFGAGWVDAVIDAPCPSLLEMKQTEVFSKKKWVGTMPTDYWVQVQVQLFCSGLDTAVLACRIGSADFVAHVVERDDDFVKEIKSAGAEFAELVLPNL